MVDEPSCPACGTELGGASAIDGSDDKPQPGDCSVCWQCLSVLVFTDTHGSLRLPTEGERVIFEADSDTAQARSIIRLIRTMDQSEQN